MHDNVIAQLQAEYDRGVAELSKLAQAIKILSDGNVATTTTAMRGVTQKRRGGARKMSPEGRARIAAAQRARWAKLRAKQ